MESLSHREKPQGREMRPLPGLWHQRKEEAGKKHQSPELAFYRNLIRNQRAHEVG